MSFYGTLIKSIEKVFVKCKFKNNLSSEEILIDPKTVDDSISIEAGDEWITFSQPDKNINKIIVNHKEPEFPEEDNSELVKNFSLDKTDISNNDGGRITLETLNYDKKGHLTTAITKKELSLNTNLVNQKVSNLTSEVSTLKQNNITNIDLLALEGTRNEETGLLSLKFKINETVGGGK